MEDPHVAPLQVHSESAAAGRQEVRPARVHAGRQHVAVRRALSQGLRAAVYRRLPDRHRRHGRPPHQPGTSIADTSSISPSRASSTFYAFILR